MVQLENYAEFEENDSILVIGKKKLFRHNQVYSELTFSAYSLNKDFIKKTKC